MVPFSQLINSFYQDARTKCRLVVEEENGPMVYYTTNNARVYRAKDPQCFTVEAEVKLPSFLGTRQIMACYVGLFYRRVLLWNICSVHIRAMLMLLAYRSRVKKKWTRYATT